MYSCRIVATAVSSSSWTLRRSGWRAQPAKSVPSYSTSSFVVTSQQLARVLHHVPGLLVGQEVADAVDPVDLQVVGVRAGERRALHGRILGAREQARRHLQSLVGVDAAHEAGELLEQELAVDADGRLRRTLASHHVPVGPQLLLGPVPAGASGLQQA